MKIVGFSVKRNDDMPGTRRRRRRNLRILLVLAVLMLILATIGMLIHLIVGIFSIKEDANIQYVGDIPVYEDFLPETSMARTGDKRKILYVVIHETDNVNDLKNKLTIAKK